MKPSAKRALLLPAWLERKYYSRAAGFWACGLQPNREVLTGGVGPFTGPARHGGIVREACVRARVGEGAGGPLGRWRREEPATLATLSFGCGLATWPRAGAGVWAVVNGRRAELAQPDEGCRWDGRAEPDRREWFSPLSVAGETVAPRAADHREAARPIWRMGSAAWPTFERRGRAWAGVATSNCSSCRRVGRARDATQRRGPASVVNE
jgi:hypothetical protein